MQYFFFIIYYFSINQLHFCASLGVNVYRIERSPLQGKIRSPWAIKRVKQNNPNVTDKECFNDRLNAEANILRYFLLSFLLMGTVHNLERYVIYGQPLT